MDRVGVFGLGRSGRSAALLLKSRGFEPVAIDEKAVSSEGLEGVESHLDWEGSFSDLNLKTLVVSPGINPSHQSIESARVAGIEVIGEVELAYRHSKAPIVAITGTNGKSTSTVMTFLALKGAGCKAILCGNIHGSGYEETALTEAAINATEDQVLVAEISSFQLETIKDFCPVVAAITNITEDHLERHKTRAAYTSAKLRIFENQKPEHYAVIRAHDPVVKPPRTPHVLFFGGMGEDALVTEDYLQLLDKRVSTGSLPFNEPHNFQNAALAALCAYGYLQWRAETNPDSPEAHLLATAKAEYAEKHKNQRIQTWKPLPEPKVMPIEVIQGLRTFKGLSHRMELVGERDGVRVINNSMCTNPDAVLKSAQVFREMKHLLIGGVNKDNSFLPLKNYLMSGHHKAYLFGRDAKQIDEQLGGGFPIFDTMNQAFEAATANALPGQIIMLAPGCASFDQFKDFVDRGNVFKRIAKDWLSNAQKTSDS